MPTSTVLPEQFGRYRILRKLGEGGMGAVYLAEDGQLGRRVAVKVPHFTTDDGPEVIERFNREARVAAAIEHPNLCMVLDVGQIDGIHYLTMPFIDGTPLARLLDRDQPWPPARAALLVIRLATALHVLHQRGIMHRDLKPANIMMRAGDDPVIMDFGLARSLTHSDRLTGTGDVVGTPAYMSPEQLLGDPQAVGSATDIYSLGVILYELVTGQLPFPGPGAALFGQILHGRLQPPSALRPGLTGALDAICCKALTRQAGERYTTMAEFAGALQRYLRARQPGVAAQPGLLVPTLDLAAEVKPPEAAPPPALVSDAMTPTPQPPSSNTERAERRRAPRASLGLVLGAGVAAMLVVLLVLAWLWPGSQLPNGREPTGVAVLPGSRLDSKKEAVKPPHPAPVSKKKEAKPPDPAPIPRKEEVKPPPRPPAEGKDFTNSIGMLMKRIAAGPFQMGSDKAMESLALDFETPRHPVTIAHPFFLATCKTTQAQFEQILGRQPSYFSASGGAKDKVNGIDTRRFPVENVAYFDAVEFCNKLSEKENRRPCYRLTGIQRNEDGSIKTAEVEPLNDGTGYRLPSEAEWEYCARAGTATRYSFGNDAAQLGEHAWFFGNNDGRTHPVAEKKANPWGLYDMGGLVYEWCDDVWHENYQGAPVDGSAWRIGGEQTRRVVRGGSPALIAGIYRCADRLSLVAGDRNDDVGFRVVQVSP